MDYLNVMIDNGYIEENDREMLFPENEEVRVIDLNIDIFDLLVDLGAFQSKGQAKKNFSVKKIPEGWSEFYVGKLRRHLCIWNPTKSFKVKKHCDSCGGPFHSATGGQFGGVKLCWDCCLNFIKWLKEREKSMSRPWRKPKSETSFMEAALASIGAKKVE
jgi:hypothetical protein